MVDGEESALTTRRAQAEPYDYSIFPECLQGKRILLCTESFGPVNGVSRTTLNLVDHLRSNGALVAVVAPHNHTNNNIFKPAHDGQLHQMEIRLTGYPLPYNPELSIVYPVRLSVLIERTFGSDNPPDLIYLASPASLGFQVMLQMRQWPEEKQIPIICNFQTDLAGYCSILFPPPLSLVASRTFGAVESFLFRHPSVKTIFYPSRFVRRYLEQQGVQPEKLHVLRRGVNTELFSPTRRDEELRHQIAPNGEIILICVSRIAGEKGFDFLARVAKALFEQGIDFKLYVVGGNRNPTVENAIHEMFDPLREKGRVIFAGFKTGEDLAAAYAAGDIFLHCSVTETFGLVVLESMASGVPVVARDEGGPSDIIADGHSGYLVPPNDLERFVSKVVQLAKDKQLREEMGKTCRRMACDATWERINNKAAWKMAEAIRRRDNKLDHYAKTVIPKQLRRMALDPVRLAIEQMVEARKVDARLAGGLGVILFFWFFTGIYVVFIELALWAKMRISRGELPIARTVDWTLSLNRTNNKRRVVA